MAFKFNCAECDMPIITNLVNSGIILCPHCAEDSQIPDEIETTEESPNIAPSIERRYTAKNRVRSNYSAKEYGIELVSAVITMVVLHFVYKGEIGFSVYPLGFGFGFITARGVRYLIEKAAKTEQESNP